MTTTFAGISYPKKLWDLPKNPLLQRSVDRSKPKCTGGYFQSNPSPNTDGRMFYHESDFAPGLRFQYCDEVCSSIGHKGWFEMPDGQGDTIRGLVFRLPHNRGFLAGWTMGPGMASEVEYTIYEEEKEAALVSNNLARDIAEKCIEDYLKGQENDQED